MSETPFLHVVIVGFGFDQAHFYTRVTSGSLLWQVRVFLLSTIFHELHFEHRLFTVFSYMFGMQ